MKTPHKPLDIFLLIGQSNMAGRGPMNTVPALSHPNVWMFRDGEWLPAREPLHTDKPDIAGVGLGMSFAVTLASKESEKGVGLLPCAVGGTRLERWLPGADLYEHAVSVTRQALSSGTPRGILWHQGEGDATEEELAESYGERLSRTIAGLRKELKVPDVPFLAGELGYFLSGHESCSRFFRVVNQQLHALEDSVKRFGCVSAAELTDHGDSLHFDSASLREFGRRYAYEYERNVNTCCQL
ncbi:MAG: sialate O-acetylesterase [Candidatus Pacebacteria bacterium]|nr:sialate O-acetylesterase [Candidatus Paceibacterota bacterium]